MILVTFALPSESAAFVSSLTERAANRHGARTIAGRSQSHDLCVLHTGVGETVAGERVTAFLRGQPPRLVISAGFAGALSEQWSVGDVFLASNFTSAPLPPGTVEKFKSGKLATAPVVIDSLEQRQEIARRAGADAVDMETRCIAAICEAAGIPLVALRAISDTLAEPFPAPPGVLFNVEKQRTELGRFAFYFARHPFEVPGLLRFIRQVGVARQALARGLTELLADLPALG